MQCPQHPLAQPLQEDGVVQGAKGCAQLKQQRDVEGARVCRGEEIVHDFDKGSFSVVGQTETRLKGLVQIIVLEVGVELDGYNAFQGFGEEWQVGDGAVVVFDAVMLSMMREESTGDKVLRGEVGAVQERGWDRKGGGGEETGGSNQGAADLWC